MLRKSLFAATVALSAAASSHAAIVITEVHSAGSGNANGYSADWIELTNTGSAAQDITGWQFDDNSYGSAKVAIRGITSIPAGVSAVFFEGNASGSTDATIASNFITAWFGASGAPAGFLIGAYGGSGVGLSSSGDAANVYDASGNFITGVNFGAASTASPNPTFDNVAGVGNNNASSGTAIVTYSAVGTNGAFLSANGVEIGSPGTTVNALPEPASLGLALPALMILRRRR